jgi:hypothetical protein
VPTATDPAERIDELLNTAEPRIALVFRTAVADLGDQLDLQLIENLLEAGNVEEALAYTRTVAEQLGDMATLTFFDAGQDTATFLSGLDLGTIRFDMLNVRAIQALQSNTLRLITEFTAEQRRATRLALLDGIARGLNPRDMARAFRDSIGLTETQQAAVIRYRQLLEGSAADRNEALTRALRDGRFDQTVNASIRRGVPLTPEQIDRMVGRYGERYIKYRSEVIGRSEALRSVHEGVNEAYQQAIDAGQIKAEDLTRTWDSSHDKRVRRTHRFLDGQSRPWGGTWATENGVLRYPGDPQAPAAETVQCRCLLLTRIRGGLKRQEAA